MFWNDWNYFGMIQKWNNGVQIIMYWTNKMKSAVHPNYPSVMVIQKKRLSMHQINILVYRFTECIALFCTALHNMSKKI